MKPRISIITVTYESGHHAPPLSELLARRAGIEWIIVDNASESNASIDEYRAASDKFIHSDTNLGFARATNLGAASAEGDFLLLMNPDTRIAPTAIQSLADAMQRTGAAIGVPLVENPAGRLRILEVGREPTVPRIALHYSMLSRLVGTSHLLEGFYCLPRKHLHERRVNWGSGACMMITRQAWELMGGLTERWFMYAEDIDLCLRAGDLGMDVWFFPSVRASHEMGGSTSESRSELAPVSSAWVLNLLDLYRLRYRPSKASDWSWRHVMWAGLKMRAVMYRVRGAQHKRTAATIDWSEEARKFGLHAQRIRKA